MSNARLRISSTSQRPAGSSAAVPSRYVQTTSCGAWRTAITTVVVLGLVCAALLRLRGVVLQETPSTTHDAGPARSINGESHSPRALTQEPPAISELADRSTIAEPAQPPALLIEVAPVTRDHSFILLHGHLRTFMKWCDFQGQWYQRNMPEPALVSLFTWKSMDSLHYVDKMMPEHAGGVFESSRHALEALLNRSESNYFAQSNRTLVEIEDESSAAVPVPSWIKSLPAEHERILRSFLAIMYTLKRSYQLALRSAQQRAIVLHPWTMFFKTRLDTEIKFDIDLKQIAIDLKENPRTVFALIPDGGLVPTPDYITDYLWVTSKSVLDDLLSADLIQWLNQARRSPPHGRRYLDIHSETMLTMLFQHFSITIRAFRTAGAVIAHRTAGFGAMVTASPQHHSIDIFWRPGQPVQRRFS